MSRTPLARVETQNEPTRDGNVFIRILNALLKHLGLELVQRRWASTRRSHEKLREKQVLVATHLSNSPLLRLLPHSCAKDGQDLVAAALNDFAPGFFVDIGAFDGRTGSNTLLLESALAWDGLLVEPNPEHHGILQKSRAATLETRAVHSTDGSTVSLQLAGQLTRVVSAAPRPRRAVRHRQAPLTVSVETATIGRILLENQCPSHINYVSIDIEGLEVEVLRQLPFDLFTIDFVTVEHNFNESRRAVIRDILHAQAYVVIHTNLSRNEDWYVRRELADHPAART